MDFNPFTPSQPQPETAYEAGRRWRNVLDDADCSFIDSAIRSQKMKIPTIKFIRTKTGLSLTASKALYEAREVFLKATFNFYGW